MFDHFEIRKCIPNQMSHWSDFRRKNKMQEATFLFKWSFQWELFYLILETIRFIIHLNSHYCFSIVDFWEKKFLLWCFLVKISEVMVDFIEIQIQIWNLLINILSKSAEFWVNLQISSNENRSVSGLSSSMVFLIPQSVLKS